MLDSQLNELGGEEIDQGSQGSLLRFESNPYAFYLTNIIEFARLDVRT